MEQESYEERLDLRPPAEAVEWAKKRGACGNEYLMYKAAWKTDPLTGERKAAVSAVCSKCGKTMLMDKVYATGCAGRHGGAAFGFMIYEDGKQTAYSSWDKLCCPVCGAKVEARHIAQAPRGVNQEAWFMTVGRIGEKLVLYGWLIQRNIWKDGTSEWSVKPYEAYVVEKKKIVRLMGYVKCLSSIRLLGHWEQRKKYYDNWGTAMEICPWDKKLLAGSTAANSKLDLFCREAASPRPVSYLRLWQKHPNVENLVVQGAGKWLGEKIDRAMYRYSYEAPKSTPRLDDINWKERRPAQMLGLNKSEFGLFSAQKWSDGDLKLYKQIKSGEPIRLPDDMDLIRKYGSENVRSLWHSMADDGIRLMRAVRYLEGQRRRERRRKSEISPNTLQDYWWMAKQLDVDLNDLSLRFPRDLLQRHDALTEEMNERRRLEELQRHAEWLERQKKKMEERKDTFSMRAAFYAPYAFEQDGIMIRFCNTEEDLIAEGKALSHCVSTYAERVAKGETAIFFIRRANKPDRSWYTLELGKDFTVRQNRGKKNCDATPEVAAFVEAWLKWLKEQREAGKLNEKKRKTKKENAA